VVMEEGLAEPSRLALQPPTIILNDRDSTEIARTCSPTMSAIGSLVFCNDCGNLLESSTGDLNATLTCEVCHNTCKGDAGQS
jgi:RNA polymerases M/15 Kd subunit